MQPLLIELGPRAFGQLLAENTVRACVTRRADLAGPLGRVGRVENIISNTTGKKHKVIFLGLDRGGKEYRWCKKDNKKYTFVAKVGEYEWQS